MHFESSGNSMFDLGDDEELDDDEEDDTDLPEDDNDDDMDEIDDEEPEGGYEDVDETTLDDLVRDEDSD